MNEAVSKIINMMSRLFVFLILFGLAVAFTIPQRLARPSFASQRPVVLQMSDSEKASASTPTPSVEEGTKSDDEYDPMEDEEMDAELKLQLEKQRRADELRAQEVFMKKSTGMYKCNNCDWEYDPAKGDKNMIGGMVPPGTQFEDLAANWRCPVCRASKDSFSEVVEEIPGFEVNQGYGFGANSWTAGQKNLAIFGGLGFFFLLFLSGYAMS